VNLAITGANSGVGRILLRHVAARTDIHVTACVRSTRNADSLPTSPGISVRVVDYGDRDGLAGALTAGCCVVHLAGILFESTTSSYQTANIDTTQAVTEACKKAGVRFIVLVSALGADSHAANRYLRSKGIAEQIVSDSGLAAAIIRTPILLGPGMAATRAVMHAASQRAVTLLGGGRHVIRPLDVDDLSRAILRCCENSRAGVSTYELVGPEPAAYRDVITRTAAMLGHAVSIRSMPIWLAKLGAAVNGWTRRRGMTPTIIDVITASESVRANADAELGVMLTPLSTTLENLLRSERLCVPS
jgi:NADH dehydrogenase